MKNHEEMFIALLDGKTLTSKSGLAIRKDTDGMIKVFINKASQIPATHYNTVHTFRPEHWEIVETKIAVKEMEHTFKIGDKVKVVKKVDKERDTDPVWVNAMDSFIGNEYTINYCYTNSFELGDSPNTYIFPASSIELVADSTKIKELLTEADVMQALLDGETLIDKDGNKYELHDNTINFLDKRRTSWVVCNMSMRELLLEKVKRDKEIIEKPWYEDIPKQGRLCWISSTSESTKEICDIISNYNNTITHKFISLYGEEWLYATPLTNEEIKQFLQDE